MHAFAQAFHERRDLFAPKKITKHTNEHNLPKAPKFPKTTEYFHNFFRNWAQQIREKLLGIDIQFCEREKNYFPPSQSSGFKACMFYGFAEARGSETPSALAWTTSKILAAESTFAHLRVKHL